MADEGAFIVGGKALHELRVVDLKKELDKRGLSKSGSKKELIERLKRQLQIERLKEQSLQEGEQAPTIQVQEDDQNEFVKKYLQQREQLLEKQMTQKKKIEEEERVKRQSESEASGTDTDQSTPNRLRSPLMGTPKDDGCGDGPPILTREVPEEPRKATAPPLVTDDVKPPTRVPEKQLSAASAASDAAALPDIVEKPSTEMEAPAAVKQGSNKVKPVSKSSVSSSRTSRSSARNSRRSSTSSSSSSASKSPPPTLKKAQSKSSSSSSSRSRSRSPKPVSRSTSSSSSSSSSESEVDFPQKDQTAKQISPKGKQRQSSSSSPDNSPERGPSSLSPQESPKKDEKEPIRKITPSDSPTFTPVRRNQAPHSPSTSNTEGEQEMEGSSPVKAAEATKAPKEEDKEDDKSAPMETDEKSVVVEKKEEKPVLMDTENTDQVSDDSHSGTVAVTENNAAAESESSVTASVSKTNAPEASAADSGSPVAISGADICSQASVAPKISPVKEVEIEEENKEKDQVSKASSESSLEDAPVEKQSEEAASVALPVSVSPQKQAEVTSARKRLSDASSSRPDVEAEPDAKKSCTNLTMSAPNEEDVAVSTMGDEDASSSSKMTQEAESEKASPPPEKDSSDTADKVDVKKEIVFPVLEAPKQRTRRWGSTRSNKKSTINISTDSLKGLIPDIRPSVKSEEEDVTPTEVKDEPSIPVGFQEESRNVVIQRTIKQDVNEEEEDDDPETESVDTGGDKLTAENTAENKKDETDKKSPARAEKTSPKAEKKLIKLDKGSPRAAIQPETVKSKPSQEKTVKLSRREVPGSTLPVDEPLAPRRSPSPARGPVTNIIHIRGLVRPYTLPQLKQLLSRTGKLMESGFWVDKIKSRCLATFETEEEAVATRKALHGVKWPSSNPKLLLVEYASTNELEHYQSGAEGTFVSPRRPPPPAEQEKTTKPIDVKDTGKENRGEVNRRDREVKATAPVRDWDKGKTRQGSRSRSPVERRRRSRERDQERERREKVREERSKERKEKKPVEEEPPAKLLDDLFRRTKSKPFIYWLPLTDEQAVEHQKKRESMREERKKMREQREAEEAKERIKAREQRIKLREAMSPPSRRRSPPPRRQRSRSRSTSRPRRR